MIINPYRFAAAGGDPTFGGNSRYWDNPNASQYGVISSAPAELDLVSGDLSIAFWYKQPNNSGFVYFMEFNDGSDSYGIYRENSEIGMGVWVGGTKANGKKTTGSLVATDDIWYHVIGTFENATSTINFYVDNSSAISTANSAFNEGNQSLGDVTFGIRTDGSSATDGEVWVSDLRVYSKLLSSGERTNIYNGTHVSDSLAGWWFLDTDDMNDNSGNGNDITNSTSPNDVLFSTDGPFD